MININDQILSLLDEKEYWLLCHIAKRINADASCWPSLETLKNDTGWADRRTVKKYIGQLVEKGVISKQERRGKDGSQLSNKYIVTSPMIGVFVTLSRLQGGGTSDAPGGGTSNAPLSINHSSNSIVELDNSTAVSSDVEQEKIPYREIIEYLNEKTGKAFRHTTKATQRKIKARWNEGFTLEDFFRVIDTKARDWSGNAKMSEYLRPDTLFGTKFESYLQKAEIQPGADNSIDARIDCQLDEEQFNAYHAYHAHIREKFPNLFHYVPILTASEYLAIRPGGERWDGLRIQLLPRHIKEALNKAHRTIEDGLLNGKQYESVKAVLDHLLNVAAHA